MKRFVKICFSLFFLITIPGFSYAQKPKKHGLDKSDGNWEVYYRHGDFHGPIKVYRGGKLYMLGEYENGKEIGKWFFFKESGHLEMTLHSFSDVRGTFLTKEGETWRPHYKCIAKKYYPDGTLKAAGSIMVQDSIELGYIKYGLWKYFDKKGKLVKEEVYTKPIVANE